MRVQARPFGLAVEPTFELEDQGRAVRMRAPTNCSERVPPNGFPSATENRQPAALRGTENAR